MNPDRSSDIPSGGSPITNDSPATADSLSLPKSLRATVRGNQLIRGVLIQGIVVIAAIFVFLRKDQVDNASLNMLFMIGIATWLGTVIASWVVPSVIAQKVSHAASEELVEAISHVDPNENLPRELRTLLRSFTTESVVVGAVLEAGAMLNALLWLLGGSMIHWGFVLASIGLMLIRFPTVEKLRAYLIRNIAPL